MCGTFSLKDIFIKLCFKKALSHLYYRTKDLGQVTRRMDFDHDLSFNNILLKDNRTLSHVKVVVDLF